MVFSYKVNRKLVNYFIEPKLIISITSNFSIIYTNSCYQSGPFNTKEIILLFPYIVFHRIIIAYDFNDYLD